VIHRLNADHVYAATEGEFCSKTRMKKFNGSPTRTRRGDSGPQDKVRKSNAGHVHAKRLAIINIFGIQYPKDSRTEDDTPGHS